jgi:prevent-host-death family protein
MPHDLPQHCVNCANCVKQVMEHRIPASRLARQLADVLNQVRDRGDSFLVERHNVPVARIAPADGGVRASLREAIGAWMSTPRGDPPFADDLERVTAADRARRLASWGSACS